MFGFGAFSTQPFCSIDYTSVQPTKDTHDGFKKSKIEKKLAEARLKLLEAKREQKLARKQAITDLVSPTPKKILSKIIEATKEIKEIEQQQHEYVNTFYIEQELARLQAHYEIMRIMQIQAQDEEDAILALLLGD